MEWITQWERINNINQSWPIKSNGREEKSFCRNIIKMQGSKQWLAYGQKFCLPVILNGPVHKGPKINFFYKSTAFQEDKHPFHRNYGTNLTYLSSFGISVIGKAL